MDTARAITHLREVAIAMATESDDAPPSVYRMRATICERLKAELDSKVAKHLNGGALNLAKLLNARGSHQSGCADVTPVASAFLRSSSEALIFSVPVNDDMRAMLTREYATFLVNDPPYCSLKHDDKGAAPQLWWLEAKRHGQRLLPEYVISFSGVRCTQASCERAGSHMKHLVNNRRTRMHTTKIDAQMNIRLNSEALGVRVQTRSA